MIHATALLLLLAPAPDPEVDADDSEAATQPEPEPQPVPAEEADAPPEPEPEPEPESRRPPEPPAQPEPEPEPDDEIDVPPPPPDDDDDDDDRAYLGRKLAAPRFRVDIFTGGGVQRIADPSYLAFDWGWNIPGPTVMVRADVRLGRYLFIGGGAGYRLSRTGHFVVDSVFTGLTAQDVLLAGRLSLVPVEGIDTFLEVGAGPSFVNVEVVSRLSATQRTVLGFFDALAGIAISLPRRWLPSDHVTAGIETGLGYTFRNRFDVEPDVDTTDEVITTNGTRFGELRLHGLLWRAGLFIRFL